MLIGTALHYILGVFIDSQLTWKAHIEYVSNKVGRVSLIVSFKYYGIIQQTAILNSD